MSYRGVWYDPLRKKFRASCEHKGQSIFIGRFTTAKQAAKAYDRIAKKIWGLKAKLNFGKWCRATHFQLKCYRFCSPDFAGLTQRQTAQILSVAQPVVCVALKRLQKKCPEIFPIYQPVARSQRFEDWMKVADS